MRKFLCDKRVLLMSFLATSGYAEVLELGKSEVHGSRPQPEEIILLSRAPLAAERQTLKFNGKREIVKEIQGTKLFDVVRND